MRSRLAVLAAIIAIFAVAPPLAGAEPIPITGEILAPDGKPVAGATARLVPLLSKLETARLRLAGKEAPQPAATATSDAFGRFSLAAPGAGMWSVAVEAKGFAGEEIALAPLTAPTLLPTLILNPTAELAVSVVDAEGRAVAGAEVEASYDPALFAFGYGEGRPVWIPSSRRGTTGADGRARLAVRAQSGMTIRSTAPGRAAAESFLGDGPVKLLLASGCAQRVDVIAGSAGGAGGAAGAGGHSVAGAVATFKGVPAGPSDAAGRLTLTLPYEGSAEIEVEGDDGAAAALTAERRDQPWRVELTPRPRVHGRVRDERTGRPVAGAFVWPEDEPTAFVTTGADGTYRAIAPPADQARLFAAAVGYFTAMEPTATSGPEPLAGPEIALPPAITLHGTVVDETGRSVAGARLATALSGLAPSRMMRTLRSGDEALTDAAGRFTLQLPAGLEYRVTARHPDYAAAQHTVPPLSVGEAPPPLRIVLTQGITASGQVVGPDGKPLAGVAVSLTRAEPARPERLWLSEAAGQSPATTTDAEGRFRFARLSPGRFDLVAGAPDFAPTLVRGLTISEAQRRFDLGTVVLRRGERLAGQVTDRDGAPLAEATVSLTLVEIDPLFFGDGDGETAVTGPDGRFAFTGLATETVALSAEKDGYGHDGPVLLHLPNAAPVEIVLDRLLRILCRLVDEAGAPVADGWISARAASPNEPGLVRIEPEGMTDERGEAALALPGPGRYEVAAQAPGMLNATRMVDVGPGGLTDPVTLTLARGAVVLGRVEGPDGGALPEAMVSVLDPPDFILLSDLGPEASAETAGDGSFRLDGLPTGPRSFVAVRRGYRKQVRDLDVRPGENRLDFRLEPGVSVSGRVVDRDGAPVPGVSVSLQGSTTFPGQVVSEPDGSFVLSGVSADTYQLHAQKEGYADRSIEGVQVASEPVAGLEVRLLPPGAIRGRILGLDFAALSSVLVLATNDMTSREASVDFEGNYRIDDLAPGDWTVMAMAGSQLKQGLARVEAGAETVLDLELGAGHRLTGRVLAGGRPMARAMVVIGGREGGSGGFSTAGSDGSFRFDGLAAGTYDLHVMRELGSFRHSRTIEIDGDTEVTIEVGAARVSGLVTDPTGDPVTDAQLTLEPQSGDGADQLSGRSDAEGRFVLAGAAPGPHRLDARKEGFSAAETAFDVPESGDVEGLRLTLSPAPSLVLEVVGPVGVAPAWVGVALLDASGNPVASGTYTPGERGRIDVKSAPAGRYRLLAGGLDTATVTLDVPIPGGPIPVRLPAESIVKVRVAPLAGLAFGGNVTVLDSAHARFAAVGGGAVNDSWDLQQGTTTIDRLPAGTWTFVVTAPDGRAWQRQVTVGTGESAELVIE